MGDDSAGHILRNNFSVDELLGLLARYETELQARETIINRLKSEKSKQLLYAAKYGQLAGSDPLRALQRDSITVNKGNEVDETAIVQMYETQLEQLERLIAVQRRCHNRSQQILAATEKRHARILRELDQVNERSAADAAQGDDFCALLEKERTRLRQQLEYEQKESDKARQEIEMLEKKLKDEQERHKSIVLYLMSERKQMLIDMHELKVQNNRDSSHAQEMVSLTEMRKEVTTARSERDQLRSALDAAISEVQALKDSSQAQETALRAAMGKEVKTARTERDQLRSALDAAQSELQALRDSSRAQETALLAEMRKEYTNASSERDQLRISLNAALSEVKALKEAVKKHEEDLMLMRNGVFSSSQERSNNLAGDSSVVMVNKGVSSALSPPKNSSPGLPPVINDMRYPLRSRLATSSTFPTADRTIHCDRSVVGSDRTVHSRVPLPASCSRFISSTIPPPPAKKGRPPKTERPKTLSTARNNNREENISNMQEIINSLRAEPEIEQLGAVIESMNSKNKRYASLPRSPKNKGTVGSQARKSMTSRPATTGRRATIFKTFGVTARNEKNGS